MISMTAQEGLVGLFCSDCGRTVRRWRYGTRVPVGQLIAAEAQHRDAAHPLDLNPNTLRDGFYENERG